MSKDYRIKKASLNGMDNDAIIWAVIEPMWNDLQLDEDEDREFMASITPGQRGFIAVDWFGKEVYNGGIEQFFANSTGVLAHEAREGFSMLGCQSYVELLDKVFALFPGGVVAKNRAQREAAVEAIPEETRESVFSAFDKAFYNMMDKSDPITLPAIRYIESHPQEFFCDEAVA